MACLSFVTHSLPSFSSLYMELELSLGDSSAPAKDTCTTVLTSASAGKREGHELVLELGTGTAKRAEQDNKKTHMQPEEDDEAPSQSESPVALSLSCHLLPAVADTGKR
jgi:homeobox-leucine zipper protein